MKKIYYGKAVYNTKEINAVTKVLKNNSLSLVDGQNVKALEKNKVVSHAFSKFGSYSAKPNFLLGKKKVVERISRLLDMY